MKLNTNTYFPKKLNEFAGFFILLLAIVILDFVGVVSFLKGASQKAVTPILQTQVAIISGLRDPYDSILLVYSKAEYVTQLESQYAQALTQLAELEQLRAENTELRRMIGTSDRSLSNQTIIGAPIVSLASPAIGVGSSEGVQEKQMVLVDGVLVGTVTEVSQHQSKVRLLSQSGEKQVIAQTQSGVEGVLVGDGKNVLLTQVPRSAEIKEGELVVTSGQEGIEKGIAVGIIRNIKTDPADATQTIVVSQLVSFYEAVLVEVR